MTDSMIKENVGLPLDLSAKIILQDSDPDSFHIKFDDPYSTRDNYQKILESKDNPSVSILVLAYNNLKKHTQYCLESILKYTDVDYELVLIDNGSSDGTFEFFKSVPHGKKTIIRITHNKGANYGVYLGMKYLAGRYAVLIANDVYVTKNWLSNILKCIESDERIGFVATASDNISNLQSVNLTFNNLEEMQMKARQHNVSDPRKWEERLRLMPAIGFYKKECLDIVGSVDYVFQHDFSDDDISIRIRRSGYKLVFCGDVFVHHAGPSATDQATGQKAELLKTGREIFRQKYYGIDAWEDINNFEMQMLALVNPEDKRGAEKPEILGIDIKCGTPILQIKNKLRHTDIFDARLSAFVQDAKYWLDLKTICEGQVVVDRIVYLTEHFSPQSFDYIILGNPINSYPEREKLLTDMLSLLKADGQLLIKLNNTFNMQAFLSSMSKGLGTGNQSISVKDINELNSFFMAGGFSISSTIRSLYNIDQKAKEAVLDLLKKSGHAQNIDAVFNELLTEIYALKITRHKQKENAEKFAQSAKSDQIRMSRFAEKSAEHPLPPLVPGKPEDNLRITKFSNSPVPGLTSIIIVTHNRLEQTKKCLKSLRKRTPEAHEIIFIDNGSTDNTVRWLQSQIRENKNYRLIENQEDIGQVKGRNQGIAAARGEFILLLDSDVTVGEGWLSGMLECLHATPDTGLVGPMTNEAANRQRLSRESDFSAHHFESFASNYHSRYRHRRIYSRNLSGFCLLFKRTLIERIGLPDERFNTTGFDDEDFCWRTTLADYRNVIAGDVVVCREPQGKPASDRKEIDLKWTLGMATPEGKKLAVLKATELANAYNAKGQMDQAVEALINCIKYAPDNRDIYFELTRLFIEAKKFPEARDVVASMPETAKNDLKGLECAGYAKEGLGDDDEAAALANQMLSLRENYAAALNLLGVLSYKKGAKDEAVLYFQRAIDADPGYGEAYTNLGVINWGLGKKDEAVNCLKKGFMLSPTVPDTSAIYYSVIFALGNFSEAESDFVEVCRLNPNHKNLAFLYIDLLIQQEKYELALLKIEDALALFGLDEGTLQAALAVREKIGPLQIEKTAKKGTLSLCMIVKNEEKHLVRCLRSVRDVVDEMIIVDTGSTDKTKDIATVFGAKVFDFPWTGDFSAARNESLAHATGDWVLILDADEAISSLDHSKLKELAQKRTPKPVAYSIVTRNYTNNMSVIGWTRNTGEYPEEAGAGWIPSPKVRLAPRRKDVFFTNPVHELLENSLKTQKIPVATCKIVVHHYGKLDVSKDSQKGEDYYLLGKIKYESDPTNVKYIFELAKQAHILKKYDETIELWTKLLSLIENKPESDDYKLIKQISVGDPIAEIYIQLSAAELLLDRFDQALYSATQAMQTNHKLKEYIYMYAYCEIIAGSLEKASMVLHDLIDEMPDYLPALLVQCVVLCLEDEQEKARELMLLLKGKNRNFNIQLNKFARQLHTNGRKDQAVRLLSAMKENKIDTPETIKLLKEFDLKSSES